MKRKQYLHTFICCSILLLKLSTAKAQFEGITRSELMRQASSLPGKEIIMARFTLQPGILAPKHAHPGDELVYVTEGTFEYYLEGREPVILKPGNVLFIPAGLVHSAKNIGTSIAVELTTYIIEKGKPLLILEQNK